MLVASFLFPYFCIVMKKNYQDLEQLSDKVVVLSGSDLSEILQSQSRPDELAGVSDKQVSREYPGIPQFVTGLKSLASTLNVSVSTIGRWKRKGLLDRATFQDGKTVIFNVHEVLDILRVSNHSNFKSYDRRKN